MLARCHRARYGRLPSPDALPRTGAQVPIDGNTYEIRVGGAWRFANGRWQLAPPYMPRAMLEDVERHVVERERLRAERVPRS